jgi:hypothetical protein
MSSISDILRVLSDENGFVIFKSIANEAENRGGGMIRTKFKLSRKQYYTRMARLISTGLITKENGAYILTAFGRVVHYSQYLTEAATKNYWKLSAVDSVLDSMEDYKIPEEERQKIIESLIDNKEIKELLLADRFNGYSSKTNEKYIPSRNGW